MKRIFPLILIFLLLGAVPAVSAEETASGSIYSTDILAYVNGKQIDSFNIGGKTVIFVEDLYDWEHHERSYGFTWNYNDENRLLTVLSDGSEGFGSYEVPRGQTGTLLGNVYATDIQVIFNGRKVPGYNIGGRTAVCIEDLGTVDETSRNFQFGYSNYLCNFKWDEENRTVSLDTYVEDDYRLFSAYPDYKLKFFLKDNQLSCSFDKSNPDQCTLETEFSDEFRNDAYQIKPVYMNGEAAGTMYFDGQGVFFAQLSHQTMYRNTKDLTKKGLNEIEMAASDGFTFSYSYDSFKDSALSRYYSICTATGTADLTVDGQHHEIDAIETYEYNYNILVDVDKMTELLGINYRFRNGDFIFQTDGETHELSISLDTAKYHEPVYKEIYNMFTGDILLNGEKTAFTYVAGGTLLTNGATYENKVQPYLYDGKAYVPFHFFELIYS